MESTRHRTPPGEVKHGTTGMYYRHLREGTETCPLCREAVADQARKRRARKRLEAMWRHEEEEEAQEHMDEILRKNRERQAEEKQRMDKILRGNRERLVQIERDVRDLI